MPRHPIHEVYRLSEDSFEQVIRDVELMRDGAQVHFLVDSHEVIDYCFPVDTEGATDRLPEAIADDQAALYEIFYARPVRPILIPEYEGEVRRHLTYLELIGEHAFQDIDLITALLGDSSLQGLRGLTREEILERMESEFSVLIAVIMGIYSIGVDRFRELLTERIQRISDFREDSIRSAHASYRETNLAKSVYRAQVDHLETANLVSSEVNRRVRAAEIDARAVDWLVHMNQEAERAATGLTDRHIFIYLSSAPKTRRLFSGPAFKRLRIAAGGKPLSFHRDRKQILAFLICRDSTDEGWHERAIENLKELKKLSCDVRAVENPENCGHSCDSCPLNGLNPQDCRFASVCTRVAKREQLRSSIPNLGLMGELPRYNDLLKTRPRNLNDQQKWCLEIFSQLLATENIGDLALAKMKALLSITVSDAALSVNQHSNNANAELIRPLDMMFLPLRPEVRDRAHADVVNRIFRLPYTRNEKAESGPALREIIDQFDGLDRILSQACSFDLGEHELVRCLVYMTHGFLRNDQKAGDYMACEYAEKIQEKYPDLGPEFDYVILWTARRLERYQQAHNAARRALEKSPFDPRFYHGRSVNTMCWLDDAEAARFCPMTAEDVIADARKAIELYRKLSLDTRRLQAVQYNNIAWLRSRDWRSKEFDLEQAREALTAAAAQVAESDWIPDFAEFFHTKANILFEEYRAAKKRTGRGRKNAATDPELLKKLAESESSLGLSIAAREHNEEWMGLLEQIKQEMRENTRIAQATASVQ